MKRRSILMTTALLGVVLIALTLNQWSYAQLRPADPPFLRPFDRFVLRGPGSQIGVTAREPKPSEREGQQWLRAVFMKERPTGMIIEQVRPNSPASRVGLLKGDLIIGFDGYPVSNVFEFTRLVEETPPGWTVKMMFVRHGKAREISITPTH